MVARFGQITFAGLGLEQRDLAERRISMIKVSFAQGGPLVVAKKVDQSLSRLAFDICDRAKPREHLC